MLLRTFSYRFYVHVSAGYTSGGIVGKGRYVDLKLNFQKTNIIACGPITSWQIDGKKMETVIDFTFLGSKITGDGDCGHVRSLSCSLQESYDQPRQHIKKQRHCFASRRPSSQSYGFSSSHVWM